MQTDSTILPNSFSDFESFNSKLKNALSYFDKPELAKMRLRFYRWKITEELDKHILEFENGVKRTGGNVLWGYEKDDSINHLKAILSDSNKVAYLPSRITDELLFSNTLSIDTLEEYKKKNNSSTPEFLIAPAKFIVSNSGHVLFCSNDIKEFEAVSDTKSVVFIAGIDSVVNNGVELELAKNLFSTYELGEFGYPLELLLKPGKPDNRFKQHIHLILIDHGRSSLLENSLGRSFFSLLNFNIPQEVAQLFWKQNDEEQYIKYPFHHFITEPLMNDLGKNKKFLFSNNGYNRLSEFLPFEIDMYDYFIQSRLSFSNSLKSNLLKKVFNKDYVKPFMEPKTKMSTKKFISFLKDKAMSSEFNPNDLQEKTFIEQYYYNKRKI